MVQRMSLDAKKDSIYLLGGRSPELRHNGQGSMSFLLPIRFLKEMAKFTKNNTLATAISQRGSIEDYSCQRCIKAHAIRTARDMRLDEDTISSLQRVFPGPAGHNGYYMNRGHLVSLKQYN